MKRKMTLWLLIALFAIVPAGVSLAYEAEDAIIISEDNEREENSTEKETEISVPISVSIEADAEETEIEEEEKTDEFILSIEDAESDSPTAISTTMESGTCGDNLIWELSDDGVMTISGTGDMTDWDYYSVMPWNDYLNEITSVIISKGVTSIGFGAFKKCVNLASVSIPVSVTTIDWYAFSGCISLTEVTIPSGVTTLGAWVFSNCTGLTEFTIPATVTEMGHGIFSGCTNLKSATILANITKIDTTFSGCTSLTEVSLPSSLTWISGGVFRNCSSLTSIILPSEITYITDEAFLGCVSLVSITIPSKVTWLNRRVFKNCTSLKSIILPAGLETIGASSFNGCIELTDVYYGGSESDWSEISIGTDNTCLTEATIHYGYSLSLNANGGSVSPSTMTVTCGLSYGNLPTPTRTGYTFTGWFTSADGGSQVLSTTIVSETDEHTLYAHWTANIYLVTFDPDGGSVSTGDKTVTYGISYGTLPTPSRTGYTFNGWYTSSSGGTQVTGSTVVATENDHTLYAHWTANTYKVTFNANGGSVSIGTKTVTYGSTYTSLPTPTCSGYVFGGWYTAADGGTKVTENTVVNVASNHTLYAHWTGKATQTISVSSSISKVYKSGKTFNLNASAEGKLTYKSSDTSIAKVSSSGKVTMKGYGTVKITITAAATSTYKKATKTVTLKLKPAKMSAPTLSSEKTGYISIEWVKNTSMTGYQVQWSLNKNFSEGSTKSYLLKKSKLNLENLTSGTVYYVRIRAYKKVDGKKIYGAWSTVKSITVR